MSKTRIWTNKTQAKENKVENSFIFAVNAVSPILIMVVIGYILKKVKLLNEELAKSINKLVFKVFLPIMLFNNIYKNIK